MAVRLETFSYLPPLSAQQVAQQIEYILKQGLVPAIEYVAEPNPRDHYWSMWKLPLFDVHAAATVLTEIEACTTAHPDCYVRLIGYDRNRQSQTVSFVVRRPSLGRSSRQ